MIKKFAQFWIENSKVTIVMILVIILWGIWSYLIIPKQYNPDIPVPAFSIIIPSPWFSAKEVRNLVVEPLEDKVSEIRWMDHIYWISNKDYWVVTLRFKVGFNKEDATTLLYNKIFENADKKPLWVKDPIIMKMDPDDFPIYNFAVINKKWGDNIKLRKIAYDLSNKLKFINGTSVFYIAWWDKDNLNILLDLKQIEAKNINIMHVYNIIKSNNIVFPWWDLKLDKTESSITIDWNINSLDKLKKLVVWNYRWKPVYLWEVAKIFRWVAEKNNYQFLTKKSSTGSLSSYSAVYVWIAKQKWVNSVKLTKQIKNQLFKIAKTLPENYKIVEVADQWVVAKNATNSLLLNLVESIIIVFIVLLFYLWKKDAINNAVAIPITLLAVFLVALIVHDNINRIVLFALVLALWMLVDNSTVVIENIARHIKLRDKNTSIKQAILNWVWEVWTGVTLATITRILALVSMFFVTWMIWQYMWWVPKYVVIALIISLFVAFSINPFLAYHFYKGEKLKKNLEKEEEQLEEKKTKLVLKYEKMMWYFLSKSWKTRRRTFKIIFWASLIFIAFFFSAIWGFRMWMLPKDNRNQIYIWLDWENNWTVKKSKEVADYTNNLLSSYYYDNCQKKNKDLCIIKNVDYSVWIAPIIDFANAFRWVTSRKMPNQVSLRINLLDKTKRDLSSIDFTTKLRPYIEKKLWSKYPDVKIRVLEDPAWPPVRSAYMLKVEWKRDIPYKNLEVLAQYLRKNLEPILKKDNVVDLYTTVDTKKTNYKIEINHQLLSSYWLSVQQVAYTIYNIFKWMNVDLIHDKHVKEPINIYLSVKPKQKYVANIFNNISFLNKKWARIYLKQFAKIVPVEVWHKEYSEDKYRSVYIYWEIDHNSIFYSGLHTTMALKNNKFWHHDFKVISWNLYEVNIKSLKDWEVYKISWGWERKLALDTFRDLWIAMLMALLAIYFLMVAQFKSFRIALVVMMTFLLWLFWIIPWFSLEYFLNDVYFTSPCMIWLIALAWIVVWNAIILIEYLNVLLNKWLSKWDALINAGSTRMRAIIITSLTTVLWSLTILWDPVWWGLWWSIVWWLSASALLTLIVIPIFLYDNIECRKVDTSCKIDEEIPM